MTLALDLREGSSPLTRGKLPVVQRDQAARGLIPAHAGKTTGRARPAGQSWAHPRSRGENIEKLGGSFETLGSSPLTRGKPGGEARQGGGERLIPAHAGKTGGVAALSDKDAAHPRSRGEN